MKIVCYYNKNLKMSPEKLASQVGHVCSRLAKIIAMINFTYTEQVYDLDDKSIIVLGLRKNKFKEKLEEIKNFCEENHILYDVQEDLGLTEVDPGTITVFGHIKDE